MGRWADVYQRSIVPAFQYPIAPSYHVVYESKLRRGENLSSATHHMNDGLF